MTTKRKVNSIEISKTFYEINGRSNQSQPITKREKKMFRSTKLTETFNKRD